MKNLSLLLITVFFLAVSVTVTSAIPTVWGEWTWAYTDPVHIVVSPSGNGTALTMAEFLGGPATDATIRIQLWIQDDTIGDPDPPTPIANFPNEDIWLEFPGANACVGGAIADAPTDSEGWFTFSRPLIMGGWNGPADGTPRISLSGMILLDETGQPISPTIVVNSPDINGDRVVNLTDLSIFAPDFHGGYAFRSDFIWDGVINLSDVVWMAVEMGEECP